MRLYEVKFMDEADKWGEGSVKVRAETFYEAVEKLRAKYPDREVRFMEMEKVKEDEVIE